MLHRIVLLLLMILGISCAQVIAPSGGPKDTQPPHAVKYSPDSAAVNFTGKKIVIRFDEYIQLNDLNNQLVVSPALSNMPEVEVRKKELIITLKDTLKPNTTFSMSFGNAIHDITENNAADNFRYVFSTGPVVDSLHIGGIVRNALTQEPEKNVLVMLYENLKDSAPIQQKPYYFTKTNNSGQFQMTNLKAGTYKLFALADANMNYLYDNATERIAFLQEPLVLNHHCDTLSLKLFKEDPKKQSRIKVQQQAAGRFIFMYAQPVKQPLLKYYPALPADAPAIEAFSKNNDTLQVWLPKTPFDSLSVAVYDGAKMIDSVSFNVVRADVKKPKVRQGEQDLRKLVVSSTPSKGQIFDIGKEAFITSSNPVTQLDLKKIYFTKGKDTLAFSTDWKKNDRTVPLHVKLLEDSAYKLVVMPGALTDCFGQKNDTLISTFKIQRQSYYGALNLQISGMPAGSCIVQLLGEKGNVIRETVFVSSPVLFDKLYPGNYGVRIILDSNADSKWTTGNYTEKRQPEKVLLYPGMIRVRSGWDMDVTWNLK